MLRLQKIVVTMPYIGGILSKNASDFPNGGRKPLVKKWMRELASRIEKLGVVRPRYLPSYRIGVRGYFADERRPDMQNLFEVVSDACQMGLDVNDKYFSVADDGYETGHLKPKLVITIEEA